MARSAAGSSTFIPPAMFTNTSSVTRCSPARFSSTASSSDKRFWSMPTAMRLAIPYDVVLASACTSTRIGREPSIEQSTAEPGVASGRSARKSAEGLATGFRPAAGHLEHAQLADRAEAVLDRPHDTMRVMPFALEIEHGVDDVLERLGAGEAAVLGHVSDEKRRDVVALGGEQKLRRRFAHLADAAGRRLKLQREHGLNRVDDEQPRPHAADFFEDALDARLREQEQRRVADAKPVAARLDLMLRLFARCVEHGADRLREVRGRLQQQRRLADAGFAAEQDERAGNDAAAEHAVEFADAAGDAVGGRRFDLRVALRPGGGRSWQRIAMPFGRATTRRRPRAPRRVNSTRRSRCSDPAIWGLRSALLADEHRLRWLLNLTMI